jgi:hypothetical protein
MRLLDMPEVFREGRADSYASDQGRGAGKGGFAGVNSSSGKQ